MLIKTEELIGPALDWAVAQCLGKDITVKDDCYSVDGKVYAAGTSPVYFSPSTDWSHGGPIIEREGMDLYSLGHHGYRACKAPFGKYASLGPTPLIAAMRCLVASKLGDEVDVPEELV